MATPPPQAGQECGAKEATPVAREASPSPSLSVGGGPQGEAGGAVLQRPVPLATLPGLSEPRASEPPRPCLRQALLAAWPCAGSSHLEGPGEALGEEARPPTDRLAEPIQVCLKLPGDSEM